MIEPQSGMGDEPRAVRSGKGCWLRDTPWAKAMGTGLGSFTVKMQPFGRLTHLISRAYYLRLAFIIKDAPETGRPKTFMQ